MYPTIRSETSSDEFNLLPLLITLVSINITSEKYARIPVCLPVTPYKASFKVMLLLVELTKLQIINRAPTNEMILYFFLVLRKFHLIKVNILRELKNINEDSLEIFIGSYDVIGVTNNVTINGVQGISL